MLQFLASTTTLNISWLLLLLIGTTAFNTPPLFFVGGFVLLGSAFYAFTLRKEMLIFVLLVGSLGVFAALVHGITFWHVRQIIAFTCSAAVWVYLYQEASNRDIFTLRNTKLILLVYVAYMILVLCERFFFSSGHLAYLISSVFATDPDWLVNLNVLSVPARLPYFSVEPSSAACAIAGIIMPCLVARAKVMRTLEAYGWLLLGGVALYFAEGMTSELFILFTIVFLFFPTQSVYGIPVVLGAIIVLAIVSLSAIEHPQLAIQFLMDTFGGIYSRIDQGLQNGSYLSRLGGWLVAARTFVDAPIVGQGFGGSGANFFNLVGQGYSVFFSDDQSRILSGEGNTINAQMVWRVPSELGIVGCLLMSFYAWKGVKLERRAAAFLDPMDHYAFLYATGVMLVSFITNGEFSLPTISAFIVLLAQSKRKLGDFPLTTPALAPVPA